MALSLPFRVEKVLTAKKNADEVCAGGVAVSGKMRLLPRHPGACRVIGSVACACGLSRASECMNVVRMS